MRISLLSKNGSVAELRRAVAASLKDGCDRLIAIRSRESIGVEVCREACCPSTGMHIQFTHWRRGMFRTVTGPEALRLAQGGGS